MVEGKGVHHERDRLKLPERTEEGREGEGRRKGRGGEERGAAKGELFDLLSPSFEGLKEKKTHE